MKKKTGSTEQWLHFIGKDKLQTFQDNFAKAYGVSMSFLDTNGNSLTVGSQNSLFCFTIEKDHAARCQENFQNDRETMQKGEPFIHVCPFGITCLYVPVFFGDKLTAIAAIGGLTYTNSNIPENLKTRFRITSYPKDQVENILQLLDSALRLLNVNTAAGFTSGSKKYRVKLCLPGCGTTASAAGNTRSYCYYARAYPTNKSLSSYSSVKLRLKRISATS